MEYFDHPVGALRLKFNIVSKCIVTGGFPQYPLQNLDRVLFVAVSSYYFLLYKMRMKSILKCSFVCVLIAQR